MLPVDNLEEIINSVQTKKTIDTKIKTSLQFDFEDKKFPIVDGTPLTNVDIEATKQWITLFFKTDINTIPVYKNKPFGTSIRKIIGYKTLNNGYFESEIEREIREGLLLCPTIKQIISFNMQKSGKVLIIEISLRLQDGTILDQEETINV